MRICIGPGEKREACKMANNVDIPIYILDNGAPTQCPMCGARTSFIDYPDKQNHTCLREKDCGYKFIGVFEVNSNE